MSQGGGFNKPGKGPGAGKYDPRTKGDGAFGAGTPPRTGAAKGKLPVARQAAAPVPTGLRGGKPAGMKPSR